MKKVYAIVVTFNGEEYIDKCLNSLLNSSYPLQIIVADNYSTDSTVEYISKNYPSVLLIKSSENLGFGKGNNLGLRKALNENADYVLLLNQDAWIQKDTIEELVKVHYKNPDYGLLSPIHYDESGKRLGWYFTKRINANDCPNLVNDIYFNQLKEIYPINFIHASGWFLSMECIREVGIFDPLFPHYGEDNDLAQRIWMNNFKIGICTTTAFHHVGKYKKGSKSKSEEEYFKYIEHLVNLKNLNFSFSYNLFQLISKTTNDLMINVFARRFYKLKSIWSPFGKAIAQTRKIKKSRKTSKQVGAFI